MDTVELFFNGVSQGKQDINHLNGKNPYGIWQIEYHKGEIKAVAYDEDGNIVAEEVKKSFGDPAEIVQRRGDDVCLRQAAPTLAGDEPANRWKSADAE